MFSQSFIYLFQNKEIKVTIEFPEHPDPKNEQNLIQYLKKIYLQKLEEDSYA